jgi:hypothetical protein
MMGTRLWVPAWARKMHFSPQTAADKRGLAANCVKNAIRIWFYF